MLLQSLLINDSSFEIRRKKRNTGFIGLFFFSPINRILVGFIYFFFKLFFSEVFVLVLSFFFLIS